MSDTAQPTITVDTTAADEKLAALREEIATLADDAQSWGDVNGDND